MELIEGDPVPEKKPAPRKVEKVKSEPQPQPKKITSGEDLRNFLGIKERKRKGGKAK